MGRVKDREREKERDGERDKGRWRERERAVGQRKDEKKMREEMTLRVRMEVDGPREIAERLSSSVWPPPPDTSLQVEMVNRWQRYRCSCFPTDDDREYSLSGKFCGWEKGREKERGRHREREEWGVGERGGEESGRRVEMIDDLKSVERLSLRRERDTGVLEAREEMGEDEEGWQARWREMEGEGKG
ncbi:hypothetical protein Tco_0869925 [Tanacetum coccineum]